MCLQRRQYTSEVCLCRPPAIFHIIHFCLLNSRPHVQFAKININTIHSSNGLLLITSQWFIVIGCDVTFVDSGTGQEDSSVF
jgi:hypothetical protein